jgi:hypothetical protein
VVEEERRDVVVVDEEEDVWLLLLEPSADRVEGGEDGCPGRVAALVAIEREADRRRMRCGNGADDRGHPGLLARVRAASPGTASGAPEHGL